MLRPRPQRKLALGFGLLLLLLWGGLPRPVSGSEDIGAGQVRFGEKQAVHLGSSVRMTISGLVAHVALTQSFRNDSGEWHEAIYVLPLPETAAVNEMEMRIGERIIRAVIQEKAQARKTYQ